MQSFTRQIIAGVLTLIPFGVTIWIVWFVVDLLIWVGRPPAIGLAAAIQPNWPELAELLLAGWFQSGLALALALLFLYLVGKVANAVVGRRVLQIVDRIVEAVPLARTIYSATQTLIRSMAGDGTPGGNSNRVVLIEFPNEHMRVVGIVTRIYPATPHHPELAAVYVPTTPNPTSGYVEIVPTARLVWLDWTKNEAMAFIVSGGAMAPGDASLRWNPEPPPPLASPVPEPASSARKPARQTEP